MPAYGEFYKKNVAPRVAAETSGLAGKAFAALGVAEILAADGAWSKLKATMRAVTALVIGTPLFKASLYAAAAKGLKSLVVETGSLEAALKRLASLQLYQRIFAPLVGGAEMARKKLAELNVLAGRGFSLDAWVAAAKTLQVFTRGAFSARNELVLTGDAAARTGNPVEKVASAIAELYTALRTGGDASGSIEELRQMGVVSDATAESLTGLAASGADMADVTRELTAALEVHRGGMENLKADLEGVNAGYEKAKRNLQEKFGEPFTEAEVENTKNYTAAIEALGPVVSRLGGFFQRLFNVFPTLSSAMLRWIAQSQAARVIVEGLIKAIALLASVAAIQGFSSLARLAFGFALASSGAGALAISLRLLAGAAGIGLVLGALSAAVGIYQAFTNRTNDATDAARREAEAHRDGRRAIDEKIDAMRSLTDQQEALKESADDIHEMETNLQDLRAKRERKAQQGPGFLDRITGGFQRGLAKMDEEIAQAEGAIRQRKDDFRRIAAAPVGAGREEARRENLARERDRALEDVTLGVEGKRRQVALKRAAEAGAGVDAAALVEKRRQELEVEIQRVRSAPYGQIANQRTRVNELEAAKLDAGLLAPEGSAVALETMAQKIEHAIRAANPNIGEDERQRQSALAGGAVADASQLDYFKRAAERARQDEDQLPDLTMAAVGRDNELVASSLQRIGGGGGVDETHDVLTNLVDLNERHNELLQEIRDRLGGSAMPANEPRLDEEY